MYVYKYNFMYLFGQFRDALKKINIFSSLIITKKMRINRNYSEESTSNCFQYKTLSALFVALSEK